MNSPERDRAYAATLADFATDATAMSPAAFAARHGHAFLLRYGSAETLKTVIGAQATLSPDDLAQPMAATVRQNFLVFAIRARGGIPPLKVISAGRTSTNDIVIDDVSVTALHAVFTVADNGTITMQDAGSKNGTFVNDVRVPRQGDGPPTPLRLGDRVRLGSVDMTFLPANEFRALVQRTA